LLLYRVYMQLGIRPLARGISLIFTVAYIYVLHRLMEYAYLFLYSHSHLTIFHLPVTYLYTKLHLRIDTENQQASSTYSLHLWNCLSSIRKQNGHDMYSLKPEVDAYIFAHF